MKPFGKTRDGVTDNLLRAYISRPVNPPQACPEFDPDLANAYIELRLTTASRSRYEEHLSECGACRKNVAALVRLADAAGSVSPARDRDRASWWSGVRQAFGALSRPQWAMATTAALVLAISLPLLLSRDVNQPNQNAAVGITTEQQPADGPQAPNQPAPSAPVAKAAAAESSASTAAASRKRETDTGAASSSDSAPNAGVPGGTGGAAAESKKSDAKSTSPPAEDAQRKQQLQLAEVPAQAGAASTSQVAKNESDQSRQQQTKDSAQQAPDASPGRADERRDKEKNARAEEVAPPPPSTASSSEAARMRGALKRPAPKLALRDSSGESVRSNERRISKKDFWFKDNTWTDKDFDPDKNLPVVTIVYDSNVYKEEIAKRAGLKPYLTGFSETERAIIVYKGKVYKLIPQR